MLKLGQESFSPWLWVMIQSCSSVSCMVLLFALLSWYFCISVDCMKSMHSYMIAKIYIVVLYIVWYLCLSCSLGTSVILVIILDLCILMCYQISRSYFWHVSGSRGGLQLNQGRLSWKLFFPLRGTKLNLCNETVFHWFMAIRDLLEVV